jgi:signal transduction histidine kinase
MIRYDVIIAVAALVPAVYLAKSSFLGVVLAVVMCVPLAFRRLYPLSALAVTVGCAGVGRDYATYFTFVALIFAAYSAVAYSRFRNAAFIALPAAGVLVAAVFWHAPSYIRAGGAREGIIKVLGPPTPGRPLPPNAVEIIPKHLAWLSPGGSPWRICGLLVMVSMISIAIAGIATHAAERIRRLRAEHEAATRRAIELERARIASELHDVVTHNVSVMIVQAGAARQILATEPERAKTSLLAVESSGRAAMGELRHLLGLLSPQPEATQADSAAPSGPAAPSQDELAPQPGVGQVASLISRVRQAGLPVELELELGTLPGDLPAGTDLAAFRVVQEALTNVLKHAGKPATDVRLAYTGGDLVIEVADAGRPIPAAGPICSGAGRGLLGLRERVALYGGTLDAGPRPGGGWLVRAQIPAVLVAPASTQAPAPPQAVAATPPAAA